MAPWTVLFTLATSFLVLMAPVRAAGPVQPTSASPHKAPHVATLTDDSSHDPLPRESPTNWSFRGVVVDEAGAVVPRASVTFYASFFSSSVSTASDGSFSLSGKAVGFFVLIAKNAAGDRQAFRLRERTDVNGTPLPPLRFVLKKSRTLDMAVVDGKGKPVSEASVGAITHWIRIAAEKTDAAGKAVLQLPDGLPLNEVFAIKDEAGLDAVSYQGQRLGRRPNPRTLSPDDARPLKFKLTGARPIRVHVVDQNHKPIAGIRVGPWSFWLAERGVSFVIPEDDIFQPKTDAAGIAAFRYLPTAERGFLQLNAHTGPHWAATQVRVSARSNSTEPTIVVYPRERVRGTVVTAEGKPAAGATIELSGSSYEFEQIRDLREADAHGAFELWLVPETYYVFEARGDKTVSAIQRRIVRAGVPVEPLKFVIEPGTRVHGRVVRAKDKSPLSGVYVGLQLKLTNEYYKLPKDQQLPNPGNSRRGIFSNIYRGMPSGPDGQFEFYVAPGQYVAQLNTLWRTDPVNIDVTGQQEIAVELVDNRPEQSVLKGRVVLKSDPTRGVPRATITGADVANSFGNQFSIVADGEGRFEVQRGEADMLVFAASDTLAGAVHIKSTDKAVTVPVGPTASATGTLIDEATGQPAANREVSFGVRLPEAGGPFSWQFPQTATTDAKGRFNVKHLAVGLKYDAHAETERNDQGPFAWHSIADVIPKDAQPIDLGECKLPAPYRPQTLEQQITRALESKKPLDVRLGGALEDARLFENHILIVAVSPKSVACRRIFAIQYGEDSHAGDEQASEALGNFTRISIDASAPRYAAELTTFLARWNLTSPAPDDALLAVIDQQGRLVSATTAKELWPKRIRNGEALAAFLKQHEGPVPDAQQRLTDALARAKREHKRVLVEQSASWCGWCHVLAKYFDRHRSLIDKDYVWIVVDPRFTHGEAVIRKLRPKAEGG
ncbi:MAG TPA: thioredoxin family protein, partial [Planctomycetaceae bacterium]|nr:thioredoxin family protein [Planctomycetaceae bacterium]